MDPVRLQPYTGMEPLWGHAPASRGQGQRALVQGMGLAERDPAGDGSPGPVSAPSGLAAYAAGDQPLPGQWVDLWA